MPKLKTHKGSKKVFKKRKNDYKKLKFSSLYIFTFSKLIYIIIKENFYKTCIKILN